MQPFSSRIELSIPTFSFFMLVDFRQILPTRALALSTRQFFTQEKVPTSANYQTYSGGFEPTLLTFFEGNDNHLVLLQMGSL